MNEKPLNHQARRFIRYQMWVLLGTTLALVLFAIGFYLYQIIAQNKQNLLALKKDVETQQEELLRREVDESIHYLDFTADLSVQLIHQNTRTEVQQAYEILIALYEAYGKQLPKAQFTAMVQKLFKDVRFFDGRGYLFITTEEGTPILAPHTPDLQGLPLQLTHQIARNAIVQIMKGAKTANGEAIVEYPWYMPQPKGPFYSDKNLTTKIAFVKRFEQMGWIIGAGDYLSAYENALKETAMKRLNDHRFGDSGYIAVIDRNGTLLTSNSAQEWNGHRLDELPRELRESAYKIFKSSSEEGRFVEYDWVLANSSEEGIGKKIAFVQDYDRWGWIVLAAEYKDSMNSLINRQQVALANQFHQNLLSTIPMLVLVVFVAIIIMLGFSRWLASLFYSYQSDLERQQREIEASNRQLSIAAHVFDGASEGVLVSDSEHNVLMANKAFTKITGYREEDLLGREASRFIHDNQQQKSMYLQIWHTLRQFGFWQGEVWNRRRNGEAFQQWLSVSAIHRDDGEVSNYVATISDISQQKQNEERLRHLTHFDALTELPNRRLLKERVNSAILRIGSGAERLALFAIGVDRFKSINDSFGHDVGDDLLKTIGHRLITDANEEEFASRTGGDEFGVLIVSHHSEDLGMFGQSAQRLAQSIAQPVTIEMQEVILSSCIGIAVYPDDGLDFDELARSADLALEHAKKLGAGSVQFYQPELNSRAAEMMVMENNLHHALQRHEFELFYQPQYRLDGHEVVGFEALIRWHGEEGLVAPDKFIPLAESTGLIIPIGEWVLNEACIQIQRWKKQYGFEVNVAVNVSSRQFRAELLNEIQQAITTHDILPSSLTIELTESTLMNDPNQGAALLKQIRALGVHVALDDFGTGYASLAYLKRFEFDKLKIDKTFVDGLPNDADDIAIVRAIIELALHLELELIAEGIETVDQENFLVELGCQQGQGYLFSRPLPAHDAETSVFPQML